LDDLLKRNSTLISTISINGLDDLITQSSKIESISIADWLLNLVEEYQCMIKLHQYGEKKKVCLNVQAKRRRVYT
ncbi:hypothetical protein PVT01_110040800, partial [Plasmodium vivax]